MMDRYVIASFVLIKNNKTDIKKIIGEFSKKSLSLA